MAKGEMQFTTIALLVITAIVLVAVIIWFLPTFSSSSSELADLGEQAGATKSEVFEAKCEATCINAQDLNSAADKSDSDWCDDCWEGTNDAECANVGLNCYVCGDGAVDGIETCDDSNTVTETECPYGSATCTACNSDCSATLSLTGEYCGDNTINGAEACDLTALDSKTCIDFKDADDNTFDPGLVTCSSTCEFVTTGCTYTAPTA
jgi:hypothetical protein